METSQVACFRGNLQLFSNIGLGEQHDYADT